MNEILQLKGKFSYKKNTQVGGRNLPANSFVESEHLYHLRDQLESILQYWKDDRLIGYKVFLLYLAVKSLTTIFVAQNLKVLELQFVTFLRIILI